MLILMQKILYPPLENSTTRIAILYMCLMYLFQSTYLVAMMFSQLLTKPTRFLNHAARACLQYLAKSFFVFFEKIFSKYPSNDSVENLRIFQTSPQNQETRWRCGRSFCLHPNCAAAETGLTRSKTADQRLTSLISEIRYEIIPELNM